MSSVPSADTAGVGGGRVGRGCVLAHRLIGSRNNGSDTMKCSKMVLSVAPLAGLSHEVMWFYWIHTGEGKALGETGASFSGLLNDI